MVVPVEDSMVVITTVEANACLFYFLIYREDYILINKFLHFPVFLVGEAVPCSVYLGFEGGVLDS